MLLHMGAKIFTMLVKQKMMAMWKIREISFKLLNAVSLKNSLHINEYELCKTQSRIKHGLTQNCLKRGLMPRFFKMWVENSPTSQTFLLAEVELLISAYGESLRAGDFISTQPHSELLGKSAGGSLIVAYGFSELLREQLLELQSEFFPRSEKEKGRRGVSVVHRHHTFSVVISLGRLLHLLSGQVSLMVYAKKQCALSTYFEDHLL